MTIRPASLLHVGQIRALIQGSPRRYVDFGGEDLPGLLTQEDSVALVGEEGDRVWGFLVLRVEERPETLAPDAPLRAHIRGAALGGIMPQRAHSIRPLLAEAQRILRGWAEPVQLFCYGREPWLTLELLHSNFEVTARVNFYQLDRLRRRIPFAGEVPPAARLEPARLMDMRELAAMDALAFEPMWHFSERELKELALRARLQVAWEGDTLAGYSAVVANSTEEAQLARLAVRPSLQGRGIGRHLLADAVLFAAEDGYSTLMLNTQFDNERSQKLYTSFGFRPMGRSMPVLTFVTHPQPA
jgi:ribosomal protein S18 acetylase RimI-like enzyme